MVHWNGPFLLRSVTHCPWACVPHTCFSVCVQCVCVCVCVWGGVDTGVIDRPLRGRQTEGEQERQRERERINALPSCVMYLRGVLIGGDISTTLKDKWVIQWFKCRCVSVAVNTAYSSPRRRHVTREMHRLITGRSASVCRMKNAISCFFNGK